MSRRLEMYPLIDLVLKLGSLLGFDLKFIYLAREVRYQRRVLVELGLGHCEIILALLPGVLPS